MFDLNDDGTVTAHLIGRDVVLRRPTIGEYRALRESVEKRSAVLTAESERYQRDHDQYRIDLANRGEDYDREEWRARTAQTEANLRAIQDGADELRVEWLLEILEVLGDGRPVTEDDLPSEVCDAAWPVAVQLHWRSRPTHPGAQ